MKKKSNLTFDLRPMLGSSITAATLHIAHTYFLYDWQPFQDWQTTLLTEQWSFADYLTLTSPVAAIFLFILNLAQTTLTGEQREANALMYEFELGLRELYILEKQSEVASERPRCRPRRRLRRVAAKTDLGISFEEIMSYLNSFRSTRKTKTLIEQYWKLQIALSSIQALTERGDLYVTRLQRTLARAFDSNKRTSKPGQILTFTFAFFVFTLFLLFVRPTGHDFRQALAVTYFSQWLLTLILFYVWEFLTDTKYTNFFWPTQKLDLLQNTESFTPNDFERFPTVQRRRLVCDFALIFVQACLIIFILVLLPLLTTRH